MRTIFGRKNLVQTGQAENSPELGKTRIDNRGAGGYALLTGV